MAFGCVFNTKLTPLAVNSTPDEACTVTSFTVNRPATPASFTKSVPAIPDAVSTGSSELPITVEALDIVAITVFS